jgi:hypothetical protein
MLFFLSYSRENSVFGINTTMFAFSYKYGFISRGLVGSVYQLLDWLLPFELMNYSSLKLFAQLVTVLYYALLFFFFHICHKRCKREHRKNVQYLVLFFTMFAVPMFCTQQNMARLDVFMVMLSLVAVILLIWEKLEFLVVVLAALGVMVHQGYVFMYANIILVLLFFKALSNEGKKRKKYIMLFVVSFVVISALFLWFELFSHANGENIYGEIVETAKTLSYQGLYHSDVVDHEILGIDLTAQERPQHLINAVQFPIFVVLFLPYVLLAVGFFRNLIKNVPEKIDKMKYLAISVGAVTILPDLLLKVDFGRWMFAILCYYCVVVLALVAMGDQLVVMQLQALSDCVREKCSFSAVLLVYPMVMTPFLDVSINRLVEVIAQLANDVLHLGLL